VRRVREKSNAQDCYTSSLKLELHQVKIEYNLVYGGFKSLYQGDIINEISRPSEEILECLCHIIYLICWHKN